MRALSLAITTESATAKGGMFATACSSRCGTGWVRGVWGERVKGAIYAADFAGKS